jgi:hypothetical protein
MVAVPARVSYFHSVTTHPYALHYAHSYLKCITRATVVCEKFQQQHSGGQVPPLDQTITVMP